MGSATSERVAQEALPSKDLKEVRKRAVMTLLSYFMNIMRITQKSIQDRGNSKCRGAEMEVCLICSNISKEDKIAGMEQMNMSKVGVEIRRKTGKMLSRKCHLGR